MDVSTVRDAGCACEKEDDILPRLDMILSSFKGEKEELISILKRIQNEFCYLPEQALRRVAVFLRLPESTVYGIGTFYRGLTLVPVGRNQLKVCRGNACRVRGGGRILKAIEKQLQIKPGESTPDLEYALETVACLGACAVAPTVVANGETYGRVTIDKLAEIMEVEQQGVE